MKFNILNIKTVLLLLIINSNYVFAIDWPSKTIEYPDDPIAMQKALQESAGTRSNFISRVWNPANSGSPVDNRAYLFALSINLYNSIPPDLQPEPQELGPDEDVYEPNLWPIKKQLYFNNISSIDGNKPILEELSPEEKKSLFEKRFKKRLFKRFKENSPEANARLAAYFEFEYLRQHIREQVVLGNILIDAQEAPASISPDELDIFNPKYYADLQDYMEKVQPLIDTLIPPWEVEKQIVAATKEDKKPAQTKSQTQIAQSKPVQAIKPATPKPESVSENTDNHFWYLLLGIIILLAVAGLLMRKRKQ